MDKHKSEKKEAESEEPEIKHQDEVLVKKIAYLEEELVRKDKTIEKLKEENLLLFKTALKNSERKVDEAKKKAE